MRSIVLFFFVLVMMSSISIADAGQYTVGNGVLNITYFQDKTNISTRSADLTSAVYGSNIYLFGGYTTSSGVPTSATYEYNITTDTWTAKTNMTTARWGMIAVLVGDVAYVFAGNGAVGGTTAAEAYNISTNAWTTKTGVPAVIAAQGITGAAYNSNVFLFYNNYTYVYYPGNDTYSQLADNPTSRTWSTAAVYGDNIYLIGGSAASIASAVVTAYNVTSDSWTTKTSAPRAIYGAVRENPVYQNKAYLAFGQRNNGEFFSTIYIYDFATNTWDSRHVGNHTRDGVAGGFVGSKVYVVGGRDVWTAPYGIGWNEEYRVTIPSVWEGNSTQDSTLVDTFSQKIVLNGTRNTTNIALGANAWAESVWGAAYVATKAADGDMATYWITADSPTYPLNWTVDLGANYTLYNITAYQSGFADYRVNEYAIWVSSDNVTYTQYVPKSVTKSDAVSTEIFSLTDVFSARYVRVQVYSKIGSWGSGIAEFKAHKIDTFLPGNLTTWHDAGTGNETYQLDVNVTTPANTNYTVWYRQNATGDFTQFGGTYTGNQSISLTTKYQNTDARVRLEGSTTATPELIAITFNNQTASSSTCDWYQNVAVTVYANGSAKTCSGTGTTPGNLTMTFIQNATNDYYTYNLTTDTVSSRVFNESGNNGTMGVQITQSNLTASTNYTVKIYWNNNTKFQDFYITSNSSGAIVYNSTGFEYARYTVIAPASLGSSYVVVAIAVTVIVGGVAIVLRRVRRV